MSDRIAVMDQGRVQQLADPRTMYERPCNAFVAEFIGTSNLLELRSAAVEGGLLRADVGDGQRLTARLGGSAGAPEHQEVVQVTVRPERIALHTAAPTTVDPSHSLVRGTVSELVYVGSLTQVSVELHSGGSLSVHAMSDDSTIRSIRPGDPVVATWSPESAHVIGPVTS